MGLLIALNEILDTVGGAVEDVQCEFQPADYEMQPDGADLLELPAIALEAIGSIPPACVHRTLVAIKDIVPHNDLTEFAFMTLAIPLMTSTLPFSLPLWIAAKGLRYANDRVL